MVIKQMKNFLLEIESQLRREASCNTPSKWKPESYIGGGQSSREYLNLKIPAVRRVFRSGFSFSQACPSEQWKIWDYVWKHSNSFETMLLASYFVAKRPVLELHAQRKLLLSWANRIDNWAHSDELSSHFAKMMEFDHKTYLPVYEKWSQSKNPWLRRQSLVGLMFYSRQRKSHLPFKTIISFVKKLISDEHYYVQKGVGWTLRECWNVYPELTYKFLELHASQIPSAAWTAATEKLSKKDKVSLMSRRKLK
jgi:3-methyladenine DNA glycosylase AlkD